MPQNLASMTARRSATGSSEVGTSDVGHRADRLGDEVFLARPAAVDRSGAAAGTLGEVLDAETVEADLHQQLAGGVEDGGGALFVALAATRRGRPTLDLVELSGFALGGGQRRRLGHGVNCITHRKG